MKYVYKVWSSEFDGELLSVEAYEEVMLGMSTADYTLHRSCRVNLADTPSNAEVICYDPDQDAWFTSINQEISA